MAILFAPLPEFGEGLGVGSKVLPRSYDLAAQPVN